MLATVPSCGATTGISIFIASRMITGSPAFTACPTLASTLNTFPAAPAVTFTEPAEAAGAAAFGAAADAPLVCPYSTVTLYTLPLTVIV